MYTIRGPTLHVFSGVHAGVPHCPQSPSRIGPACPDFCKRMLREARFLLTTCAENN